MYFHNSLIPRGAYFLLPLESKQEATTGWNFTKCILEVKVNQLKVKNMHVRMGISTFKNVLLRFQKFVLQNGASGYKNRVCGKQKLSNIFEMESRSRELKIGLKWRVSEIKNNKA